MAQYLGKLQIQLGSSTHFQVSWGTIHCPDITGLSQTQDTSGAGHGSVSGKTPVILEWTHSLTKGSIHLYKRKLTFETWK